MNDPTRPLSPDIVDELLSADIDGEFDRAASELGFTTADARAALDRSPGTAARRGALVRARGLIATPSPFTPAEARRLVASVLERPVDLPAAPAPVPRFRRRRFENGWRVLVAAGSAAAVIAAIVAVSASRPGSESKSGASRATSGHADSSATTPLATARSSIAWGDVSASYSLRAKVRTELRTVNAAPSAPTQNPANSTRATDAAKSSGTTTASTPEFASGSTRGPVPQAVGAAGATACVGTAQQIARASAGPVLSGTGTYGGKSVVVAVFRQGGGYTAYLLSRTDCSLVARESVP